MPRLPPIDDEQAGDTPLVAAIRARRGGVLLNLDRQLLHSPRSRPAGTRSSAPSAPGFRSTRGYANWRCASSRC